MNNRRKQFERGFTLLELLFIIMIIGILSSIALTSYHGIQQTSLENTVQQDLHNAAVTCETYYGDNQSYIAFGPFTGSAGSGRFVIAPGYSIKLSDRVTMKGIILPDQTLNLVATHPGASGPIKIIRHVGQ